LFDFLPISFPCLVIELKCDIVREREKRICCHEKLLQTVTRGSYIELTEAVVLVTAVLA